MRGIRLTVALALTVTVVTAASGAWTLARVQIEAESLKADLTERLSRWTGGEVTMGQAALVGQFPNFALEAEDVRLRSGSRLPIEGIAAPAFRIEIDRGSLFWGPLRMARLELVEPRIVLAESAAPTRGVNAPNQVPALVRALRTAPVSEIALKGATVIAGSGLEAFTELNVEMRVGEAGASRGSGSFRWRGERVAFEYGNDAPTDASGANMPMRASLNSQSISAKIEGRATIAGGPQLTGEVELDIPRLRALAHWLGVDMQSGPGFGAFKAAGHVNWVGRRIAFDQGNFVLDNNSARGSLALEFGGPQPLASGTLALQGLDLSQYFAVSGAEVGAAGALNALDLTFLRALDLDLRLSTTRLDAQPLTMGQTALTIAARNGVLAADFSVLALCGGAANGRIEGDFSQDMPRLHLAATFADLQAKPCIERFAAPSLVDGTARVSANLRSRGRTLRQLLARLEGTAEFAIAEGQADIDIMKILTQARAGDLKGWESVRGTATRFDTLAAECSAQRGVAVCKGMDVTAGETRITGGGIVDLAARSLDWQFDVVDAVADRLPRMRQLLTNLGSEVVVTGSLFEPTFHVFVDKNGWLEHPRPQDGSRPSDRAALDNHNSAH